jgi:7-keto-8-aminopelargonate synthetase-like enzyme
MTLPILVFLGNAVRHLRNNQVQRAVSRVPKENSYKLGLANFYAAKTRIGADLRSAAAVLDHAVISRSESKRFVNDWKVTEIDGLHMTVESVAGQSFRVLNLATNSYNDLDTEILPRAALAKYVETGILSSCLSRKIAGEVPVHRKLQDQLNDFLGYDSTILATSGYIAQQAAIFGLFGEGDVIFSDQHNHSSLVDGMRLSRAKVIVYPHLDYDELRSLLAFHRSRYNCAGIVSDGVFSAHGTIANMDAVAQLQREFNTISVIDDTHGFMATGCHGRGILDHFSSRPDILTASMAKGLAAFGGFISGSRELVRVIDCIGRQNINTSHLSPILAAQASINLEHFISHQDVLVAELDSVVSGFHHALAKQGISPYADGSFCYPIFSFCTDTEDQAIDAFLELAELGFMGALFPPPVAPKPTLRFSLHRKVPVSELERLAREISRLGLRPLADKSSFVQHQAQGGAV